MQKSRAKSLPVIMYHYISDFENTISVSPKLFNEQCRTLARHGWRGVSLAEAEGFLVHGRELPERSVLITFDDGYLDNYLYALPILAAHGHKGVMFAVSDRLEASEEPRVPLEEALAGRSPYIPELHRPVRENELGYKVRQDVFCNRGEVRAMEESGVMAVAAHSRGHYGVAIGPEIKGMVRPGKRLRTFYRTEEGEVYGMPEFTVKPGLLHRAFVVNPELTDKIRELVPQEPQAADMFLSHEQNRARVWSVIKEYEPDLGRYETDEERKARMWRELAQGKEELEAILGHEVTTLCWPWGKYSPEALALGRKAGFTLFLTTKEGANPPGKPLAAHRFKGRARSGDWLLSRVRLYARPWLGSLYARLRI